MPIPMGRSGNVDGEGGTADGALRAGSVADAGRVDDVPARHRMRERLVAYGFQPGWTIRWIGPTLTIRVVEQGEIVSASTLEPEPIVEELPDDADDHGADDA